jgi:hypothetical protein
LSYSTLVARIETGQAEKLGSIKRASPYATLISERQARCTSIRGRVSLLGSAIYWQRKLGEIRAPDCCATGGGFQWVIRNAAIHFTKKLHSLSFSATVAK